MSLLELLNTTDAFARTSGIQLTEVGEGYARACMVVEARHLNGGGVCQGGAIFTLADLAMAAAANSHGSLCLGINAQIHFVSSGRLGDVLTAECHELSARKLPLLEARVTRGDGTLVALVTGECYRKEQPMPYDSLM